MSEKYDGVRAYWNGEQLLSRSGNRISYPPGFVEGFPHFPLDGELWLGRKSFEAMIVLVTKGEKKPRWNDVKYMVFDLPTHSGTFEQRIEELNTLALPPRIEIVQYQQCTGLGHLKESLEEMINRGGEGLILRQPKSHYIPGRFDSVLKVKVGTLAAIFL